MAPQGRLLQRAYARLTLLASGSGNPFVLRLCHRPGAISLGGPAPAKPERWLGHTQIAGGSAESPGRAQVVMDPHVLHGRPAEPGVKNVAVDGRAELCDDGMHGLGRRLASTAAWLLREGCASAGPVGGRAVLDRRCVHGHRGHLLRTLHADRRVVVHPHTLAMSRRARRARRRIRNDAVCRHTLHTLHDGNRQLARAEPRIRPDGLHRLKRGQSVQLIHKGPRVGWATGGHRPPAKQTAHIDEVCAHGTAEHGGHQDHRAARQQGFQALGAVLGHVGGSCTHCAVEAMPILAPQQLRVTHHRERAGRKVGG